MLLSGNMGLAPCCAAKATTVICLQHTHHVLPLMRMDLHEQLQLLGCCQQAEAGPLEVEEADDAELEQPEIEQVWTIKARALSPVYCSHSFAEKVCALQHDCSMPDFLCIQ